MRVSALALAVVPLALATMNAATGAPTTEKQAQSALRQRYTAIEQGWKKRSSAAIAAVWADDYTETWPDPEPEPGREPKPKTRDEALKELRTNLGNRRSTWTRTHQILGVKLLGEGEEAEVWVRTRSRGILQGEKWKLSLSSGWILNRGDGKTTIHQATTELHTWMKSPAGWRLRTISVKKTQ